MIFLILTRDGVLIKPIGVASNCFMAVHVIGQYLRVEHNITSIDDDNHARIIAGDNTESLTPQFDVHLHHGAIDKYIAV